MNTMMVVDDEYMILKGIPKLLNWDELDIEIVKTEKSPVAALKYLKNNNVDILLSDMNMAELPGTKFLPIVRKIQPKIQIIVLSGYEDFSYAKASLEQGVVDYLNKPVDPDELEEAIEKARRNLKKNRHEANIEKRVTLRDILNGRILLTEISRNEKYFYLVGINDKSGRVVKILAEQDNILGYQEDAPFIYVLLNKNKSELDSFNNKVLPLVKNEVYSYVYVDENIVDKFKLIKKKLNEISFYNLNRNLIEVNSTSQLLKVSELASQCEINDYDDVKFEYYLQDVFKKLGESGNSIADAKYFSRLLLMKIYGEKQKIDLDFSSIIAKAENAKNVDEIRQILLDLFRSYQKDRNNYPDLINQVLQYIDQNYMKELTLKNIANTFHMNSVYLGAIFKKNLNQTFAQYLNSYRIAKAITLITETNKDINEIALFVGYNNANYFFRVFKEQTNMAPSEYRRMIKDRRVP